MRGRRYPFRPLLDLDCYRLASSREIAKRTGYKDSTIRKWRSADLLPERAADVLAVRAGYHPGNIWPEWWTQ